MKPIDVTEKLSISPQPQIGDFAELKQQGFTMVINNRPDGEDPAQPGSAAEEAAARNAGLAYVHIPVRSTDMTDADARRFGEAIDQAPGPVVAHCRSGARSFYLWLLGGALKAKGDAELLALAEKIGVDTKAAAAWLATHRNQLAGDQI
jgi:uncharacterized protein (TIGR01244 family)